MNRLIKVLLMTLVALASLRPAAAQTKGYTVTDLGLIPNATSSRAYGINDKGSVVGNSPVTVKGVTNDRGWLWTPTVENGTLGSLRMLELPTGWNRAYAYDINNAGMVVGSCYSSTSGTSAATFWRPFTNYVPESFNQRPRDERDPSLTGWTFTGAGIVSDPVSRTVTVNGAEVQTTEFYVAGRGRYEGSAEVGIVWRVSFDTGTILGVTRVNDPSGSGGWPHIAGLNSRGQVSGDVTPPTGSSAPFSAYVWDGLNGSATKLPSLGGTDTWGEGINDHGAVVGASANPEGLLRGFLWTPAAPNGTEGTMVALGTLGGTRSEAYDINNANQVVGYSVLKGTKGDGAQHACLWQNGVTAPTDLNSLKAAGATEKELREAYGINNQGAIIGYFYERARRAFLLTPRP